VVSGTCSPSTTSSAATLTVNANPTAFNVTGGGSYLSGAAGGVVGRLGRITIGSQYHCSWTRPTPVRRRRVRGPHSRSVDQTATGTYTVVAADGTTGCTAPMNGSATVAVIPLTPFQEWQVQYFGCTDCPQADAAADPDGDGQNNMAEFLSGTNPTTSISVLRIISVSQQGIDINVTWSTAGGSYQRLNK